MKILAYDTETTGLPVWKEPSESPQQPHLVEIGALLIDTETLSVLGELNTLVRPDGWAWDADNEAFKVHGITAERCMDEGMPESSAIACFLALHAQAYMRVAHNESFDARILRIAMKRYGTGASGWDMLTQDERDVIADSYKAVPAYCTMRAAGADMQLPATEAMRASGRRAKYKNPTLREAHEHYFGCPNFGAHRALSDAEASARLYLRLKDPNRELPATLIDQRPELRGYDEARPCDDVTTIAEMKVLTTPVGPELDAA